MNALYSISPIFLIIITGVLIKKLLIQSDDFWKNCERLIYYFFFPCLLVAKLSQVNFNQIDVSNAVFSILIATLIVIFLLVVSEKIFNFDSALFTSVFQGSIRFNTYIYIAIAFGLYGETGLSIAIVIAGFMIFFLNLACVIALSVYGPNSADLKKIIKDLLENPLILSVIAGYLISYFNIPIHQILTNALDAAALGALPLSLISVGAGLRFAIGKKKWLAVFASSAIKLIGLPMIAFLVLSLFGVEGLTLSVAILFTCTACAASSYILARQMGGDSEAMASIITLTTLGSIITMPLMLGLTN